ncbi:MAG: SH3 domain-containing protein [Anaerolineae bacterium]|nr:SH3 domain-containing protein [Anaerolineae bacterium]
MQRWLLLLVLIFALSVGEFRVKAQEDLPTTPIAQENTPIQVQINTATFTPTPTVGLQPTNTPEIRANAQLQARAEAGDVNIRDQPDIEVGAIIGTIRAGTQYIVTGRYFRWFQIQYEDAPGGVAWVFEELVEVTGDLILIPDLSQLPQATLAPLDVEGTETAQILLQTPGAILTLTADTRELVGPVAVGDGTAIDPALPRTAMPTFTYPPGIALLITPTGTLEEQTIVDLTSAPPPITPILVLGGLGVLGLLIGALRR